MNLRNWTKNHTFGLLLGMASPLIFVPITMFVLGWLQNSSFQRLWYEFVWDDKAHIKIITISIISNLIWFYLFLNREKYNFAMGVILGSICYAPYIVYIKFFS